MTRLALIPIKKMDIFIDTSIFIKENFFKGKKMERLAVLSNQNHVNLLITDVVDKEIVKNLKQQIREVADAQVKFQRQLETKHRIIKNTLDSDELIIFNENLLERTILNKYYSFKKFAKIKIIKPGTDFNISKILEDYFNSYPPFDQIKKKEEFPDAISFKLAEDYCKTIEGKGFFFTADKDFSNIESNWIDIIDDLNNLLEEIIKGSAPELFQNETQVKNCINKDIHLFKPVIEEEVRLDILMHALEIFHKYDHELSFDSKVTSEIDNMNIEVFDISDHSIGFKCSGNFHSLLYPIFDGNFDFTKNSQILVQENLKVRSSDHFKFVGSFETTFYYSFEFPYEILNDSIEIEEEKVIMDIKSI